MYQLISTNILINKLTFPAFSTPWRSLNGHQSRRSVPGSMSGQFCRKLCGRVVSEEQLWKQWPAPEKRTFSLHQFASRGAPSLVLQLFRQTHLHYITFLPWYVHVWESIVANFVCPKKNYSLFKLHVFVLLIDTIEAMLSFSEWTVHLSFMNLNQCEIRFR